MKSNLASIIEILRFTKFKKDKRKIEVQIVKIKKSDKNNNCASSNNLKLGRFMGPDDLINSSYLGISCSTF